MYATRIPAIVLIVGALAVVLHDTWEWDGSTWIERTPATIARE